MTDNKPLFEKPEFPPLLSITYDSNLSSNKLLFGETGVLLDGQYSSYRNILANHWKPTALPPEFSLCPLSQIDEWLGVLPLTSEEPLSFPKETTAVGSSCDAERLSFQKQPSWMEYFVSVLGKDIDNPDLFDPNIPLPSPPEISSRFTILGEVFSHMRMGGVNGIATSLKDATAHAKYLAKLANGHSIEWVYNRSHGSVLDLAEVFTLNYAGFSPHTSDLLQETWLEFHNQNIKHPEAKYLQFCHSQGAIHVRNALEKLPKEIRNRVIVVAIAPAAIISKELCYEAYNYASKKDVVNYGEFFWASAFDSTECGTSKIVERILELRSQLILLDPHPDATGLDHDFQSPTFMEVILRHMNNYIKKNGRYK